MSLKAMAYAWETNLKGTNKLMLLAIADRCDDEGVCFPGVDRLAKKCSISKRQAQKTLSKLEELGELAVYVGKGIETKGGATNRYFLTAYRKTIGLDTNVSGSRAEQHTTNPMSPTTWEGCRPRHGGDVAHDMGGMSPTTYYTSENTSENTKDNPAADAAPQFDDLSESKKIVALLTAYKDASGSIDSSLYKNKTYRRYAADMAAAGVRPAGLTAFVQKCQHDPFWQDKVVTLKHCHQHIAAWLATNPVVYTPAPFDWEADDQDDEIPDEVKGMSMQEALSYFESQVKAQWGPTNE